MLGRLNGNSNELIQLLQSAFTHSLPELLAVHESFVDFGKRLARDEDQVGSTVATVILCEDAPVSVGHGFLIAILHHFDDIAPILVMAGTNMVSGDVQIAHLRQVRPRAEAHFLVENEDALVDGVEEFAIGHEGAIESGVGIVGLIIFFPGFKGGKLGDKQRPRLAGKRGHADVMRG